MSQSGSDSFRNVTRYLGQDYRFAPTYIRPRAPTTNDVKPKEQQGFYPINSFWSNSTNGDLWVLLSFFNSPVQARWVLLTQPTTASILDIGVPNGTSPIPPDVNGLVNFTSTGGSVTITGTAGGTGAQNINFDILNFSQGDFSSLLTIQGTINPGAPTYTSRIGRYQKIGRIATVNYLVSWSDIGGATGNIQCNGLPFASANISGNSTPFLWTDANLAFEPGAGTIPVGILASNSTNWSPHSFDPATGGNSQIPIPSTGGITATIIYETV